MFEKFLHKIVTLSDPRDTTLGTLKFEQTYHLCAKDVRTPYRVGDTMTILEMQTRSQSAVRWTEVCAAEHTSAVQQTVPAVRRPSSSLGSSVPTDLALRVLPLSPRQVRSCSVSAPAEVNVVDDVPTWILLACGVIFGLLLLLAVALLGGPTYG